MVFLRKYPYLCHRGLLHLSFFQTKKNTCYAVHEQQSDYFSFFLSLFFLFTIFYDFALTNMKEEATHGIVWQRGLGWVNLSHAPPPEEQPAWCFNLFLPKVFVSFRDQGSLFSSREKLTACNLPREYCLDIITNPLQDLTKRCIYQQLEGRIIYQFLFKKRCSKLKGYTEILFWYLNKLFCFGFLRLELHMILSRRSWCICTYVVMHNLTLS